MLGAAVGAALRGEHCLGYGEPGRTLLRGVVGLSPAWRNNAG